jgi:hypothetical protein
MGSIFRVIRSLGWREEFSSAYGGGLRSRLETLKLGLSTGSFLDDSTMVV